MKRRKKDMQVNFPKNETLNPQVFINDKDSSVTKYFKENEQISNLIQGMLNGKKSNAENQIDKNSELYKKSLELEAFFVKIMLNTMRNTIHKTSISAENSATQTFAEDMLYDKYSETMAKNAHFGLAEKIYTELQAPSTILTA